MQGPRVLLQVADPLPRPLPSHGAQARLLRLHDQIPDGPRHRDRLRLLGVDREDDANLGELLPETL